MKDEPTLMLFIGGPIDGQRMWGHWYGHEWKVNECVPWASPGYLSPVLPKPSQITRKYHTYRIVRLWGLKQQHSVMVSEDLDADEALERLIGCYRAGNDG